jgi:hypothetical protein
MSTEVTTPVFISSLVGGWAEVHFPVAKQYVPSRLALKRLHFCTSVVGGAGFTDVFPIERRECPQ